MKTASLSESLLARLSEFVASRFGLNFPRSRWHDFERGVRAAYDEYQNAIGLEAFVHRLLASSHLDLQPLIRNLTVGETYFLREKRSYETVCERIVPDLLRRHAGRQIKIWSAGCATGEEPYSLAIMLDTLFPNVKDAMIMGTDLNAAFLERATEGVYGEWSFREAPRWLKERYFESLPGGRWAISPAIKKAVTFRSLNLMEDLYPSPLNETQDVDLVLCRNLLMYCTSRAMKEIVNRFHRCLVEGGWLIVGTAEVGSTLFSQFDRVSFNEVTVYRKQALGCPTVANRTGGADSLGSETAMTGKKAGHAESYEVALTNLDADSRRARSAPQGSYEQALESYRYGEYQDAEQTAFALISANPDDSRAALLLARVCANSGKFREALEYCEKALEADKMSASAYYLRALIFEEQSLLDQAVSSLKRATYIDPRFILGHFALGNLAAKHRALGDPTKHYENALALLARCAPDEIVPESEGMSVRELRRIVLGKNRQTAKHMDRQRHAGPRHHRH